MARMISTNSPDMTSTIEEYIASGSGTPTITWYNYSILQPENTTDNKVQIQFELYNLVDDYLDIFEDAASKVTMTQKEQQKYFYNPELLAYDLYGSTEFDFLILKINGIIDPKEFDIPDVKLIPKSTLVRICSDIYNSERSYIKENRRKYKLQVLTD